jgi:hypothetical protein
VLDLMSRAFLSRGGARFAIQMKVSAGLALAGAMHTKLWLRAYALSNDLESTMNAPTLPSLAMPSLHNPVSPRPLFSMHTIVGDKAGDLTFNSPSAITSS